MRNTLGYEYRRKSITAGRSIYSGDLFERSYEKLVGRDKRFYGGEYYTPKWLADLVLRRLEGYGGVALLGELF